jgi:hypothetical protein
MLNWLFSWFFGRKLDAVLDQTKTVKINGVRFKIKKVNVLNHLDGSKVMLQSYDIYKQNSNPQLVENSEKKIREHLSHVLVAGVLDPKLSLKDDGSGIYVDRMFSNWEMVNKLYEEIMTFTYGKKKVK